MQASRSEMLGSLPSPFLFQSSWWAVFHAPHTCPNQLGDVPEKFVVEKW